MLNTLHKVFNYVWKTLIEDTKGKQKYVYVLDDICSSQGQR